MENANLEIAKAHRDRLWKAMGEIEEIVNSFDKQLGGLYKQKLWVPIHEKREEDARAQPEYFDGIARLVNAIRPIIIGAK